MWGILIALLSGALMSIQGVFNTEVTRQSSIWVSAGWVQLTAFVTCLVMWLLTGRPEVQGIWQVRPWYMLSGGVIGTDCCSLWNRGIWAFWSRKERLGVEKSDWGIDCRDWNYHFPEIMLVFRK